MAPPLRGEQPAQQVTTQYCWPPVKLSAVNWMLRVARLAPVSWAVPDFPAPEMVLLWTFRFCSRPGLPSGRFCCVPVIPLQFPLTELPDTSPSLLEANVIPPPPSHEQPPPGFVLKPLPHTEFAVTEVWLEISMKIPSASLSYTWLPV